MVFYLIDTANGILKDTVTVKNVSYRPTQIHHVSDGFVFSHVDLDHLVEVMFVRFLQYRITLLFLLSTENASKECH